MIRRAAMMTWEWEHSPGPRVLLADVKLPNQEPQLDDNDAVHWGYVRDGRGLIIKEIESSSPNLKI
jgi:hypothetical protein